MNLGELLMLWAENGSGGPQMNVLLQQAIERGMKAAKRYNKPLYRGTFVNKNFINKKTPRIIVTKTLQSWTKDHFTAATYASSNGPVHSRKPMNAKKIPVIFVGKEGVSRVKSIDTKKYLGKNSIDETILARPYFRAHFDKATIGKYKILEVPVEFFGSSTQSW